MDSDRTDGVKRIHDAPLGHLLDALKGIDVVDRVGLFFTRISCRDGIRLDLLPIGSRPRGKERYQR
jgi:hypothetical protein